MYVLVPMPALFFGTGSMGGGSNLASGWEDAGKFLVGFSAVGSFAIPAILFHAAVRRAGGAAAARAAGGGPLACVWRTPAAG